MTQRLQGMLRQDVVTNSGDELDLGAELPSQIGDICSLAPTCHEKVLRQQSFPRAGPPIGSHLKIEIDTAKRENTTLIHFISPKLEATRVSLRHVTAQRFLLLRARGCT